MNRNNTDKTKRRCHEMQKLGRFFLLLNPESHKGQYLSKKRKREREGERERERER